MFNVSVMYVWDRIEEKNEDNSLRCIDTMHYIYHSNIVLTWDDVKVTRKNYDPHLT